MGRTFAFLDTGTIGLACQNPDKPDASTVFLRIIHSWPEAGVTVVLPEIADYELRRELERLRFTKAIERLDDLRKHLVYLPIQSAAMRRAAALWADVRRTGQPTANDPALDGDVILAAQALEYVGLGDEWVVITENARHMERFATTRSWRIYQP